MKKIYKLFFIVNLFLLSFFIYGCSNSSDKIGFDQNNNVNNDKINLDNKENKKIKYNESNVFSETDSIITGEEVDEIIKVLNEVIKD